MMSPEEETYRRRTRASERFFLDAREYLPGGDSRSTLFYPPYPVAMQRGEGCRLWDVDGNALLDFTGNHSALVLGYGHPRVLEAVREQLNRGTAFPGAAEPQLRMARLLGERVASLERVRFTSSGTEATMYALRAARAFTGRPKTAKIEGGYNGSQDGAMVSTYPLPDGVGSGDVPVATASSRGLPPESVASVVALPFNDADAAVRLIEREATQLAAVIVEPVMGSAGMIPAEPGYLEALREVSRRFGVLLIFDEVVSFRVAHGGAQEHYRVAPDLTCLGKLIGGGFPLGAFGGREEVMALFDPSRGRPAVPHPGSYNANPVSLTAGAATLELLSAEEIAGLNGRGEALRDGLRSAFREAEIAAQVTGLGSLFAIHLTPHPVRSPRDAMLADEQLRQRIFLGLCNRGVLIDPRGVGTVSTAIGDAEIERFVGALSEVLDGVAESGGSGAVSAGPVPCG